MNDRFTIIDTSLAALKVIQRKPSGDQRGFLERMYCTQELESLLGDRRILQINHTLTCRQGTVRGMHFQYPPHAETKLVSCLRGEVFDVAVDIREGSPTFLQAHVELLSESNYRTMLIPEGFAHGFQTLSAECEMLYFHTAPWCAEAEGGLDALDSRLAIEWPLSVTERSQRDQQHSMIENSFRGISV